MFERLLIANRGEIACRIIRTAKRLGVQTIAVYSDVDANAQHVQQADVAVSIGANAASDSYLNIAKLIEAAKQTHAQAIHPGYGFLSENAEFVRACDAAGIVFVGPTAESIELMGSKIAAKNTVAAAGTPVVPGYQGDDQSDAGLAAQAQEVGFPLLIKASAGGGGKGMRLVEQAGDFADALAAARREASAAFGDDRVLLEKYLTAPKHLEVQILADGQGKTLHLHERDCSVQRRHQKVIEEAPGPTVDEALRSRLGAAAVQAAAAINYRGAGTIEFIAEAGEFYFMEMNTRLQVEHPVTEAITGLDLVAWQLRIASGEPLTLEQQNIQRLGHAIEARIYAENPAKNFLPASGPLHRVHFPPGVRVDTGVVSQDAVSTFYDPMIAKVIAQGETREAARLRLLAALRDTSIVGIEHNVGYVTEVLQQPDFVSGQYTTGTVEAHHADLTPAPEPRLIAAAVLGYRALLAEQGAAEGVWHRRTGFRQNIDSLFAVNLQQGKRKFSAALRGERLSIEEQDQAVSWRVASEFWRSGKLSASLVDLAAEADTKPTLLEAEVLLVGTTLFVVHQGRTVKWLLDNGMKTLDATAGGSSDIVSPMPGQLIAVNVKPGQRVRAGEVVAIVEAMKMEHSLVAPYAAKVASVSASDGSKVDEGQVLVSLEEAG